MTTKEKIQQLEREVATLWHIVEDDRIWDSNVVREIQKRSQKARLDYSKRKLRTAEEVFLRH